MLTDVKSLFNVPKPVFIAIPIKAPAKEKLPNQIAFKPMSGGGGATQAIPFTTVNQNTVFSPININQGSAGLSVFGSAGGTGGININQTAQNTSNVSTQVSNTNMFTNTTSNYTTNQTTNNTSTITGSPYAGQTVGSTQESTPSTAIIPTQTPVQTTTQTATPTATATQSAGLGGGAEWWQYLIIGGVAIIAIYYISQALGKKGGGSKAAKAAKYAKYVV